MKQMPQMQPEPSRHQQSREFDQQQQQQQQRQAQSGTGGPPSGQGGPGSGKTGGPGRGELRVSIQSRSGYFGANARVEVRDSNLRVVERFSGANTLTLDPGVYQVSAVLEDGREHSRIAQIEEGRLVQVQIAVGTGRPGGSRPSEPPAPTKGRHRRQLNYVQRLEEIDEGERATVAPNTGIELLDVQGADLVRSTRTLWVLEGGPDTTAVPVATLALGDRRVQLSLPTGRGDYGGSNPCAIRVDEAYEGVRVGAWISPERTVANALQNMVGTGHFGAAASMANEATELLRSKYSDPTGAALGGLVLHRAGRLDRYRSWLENLTNDFGWLPDGKILLAALLVGERVELDRARDLVVQACSQRVLYTESYSILLGLLRRWPDDTVRSAFSAEVSQLARRATDTDWEAMCLSQTVPE